MILVVDSHAVAIQKVALARHALVALANLHSENEMEIPASVRAAIIIAVAIPIVRVLHALAEASLPWAEEMTTPASVQKDIQSHLKKEKVVETDRSEKDHPIHFNPAQTAHHVLERNLFRKEMMEPEVKDLIRKEMEVRSNHVLTDHQVLANAHSQNGKEVAMRNPLSEKVLLAHAQVAHHDSKRNRLTATKKVVKDHSKTEIQVHSIHAAHVRKDVMVSPRNLSPNVKKVVMKNHSRKLLLIHSIQTQATSHVKRNLL
jgi:hypothetical protein